ncbi:Porphobilinogen deaminase [Caulifigura coniformis]|uniref:Porphobilinogen deaminase n=1 Tax=Caulifigura coniformis TaxID=2527983 RepID=A0A517SK38_9PLAN|nr:hydroxymethylbilane synthase [Caulifigura coniformis]QDT56487.1 Porphobilinogen deaminase [Caulifigura coniformis]
MNSSSPGPLRIATRASALATWQAEHVAALLRAAVADCRVELVPVTTQGDRDRNSALSTFGGVGVFTREVQQAVLDGRADLAVHSLKDLPTEPTDGLLLGAVLPRAPRCDALLLPHGRPCSSLEELPQEARVGTGSLRRQAQLLAHRPDLRLGEIRGNLDTRLRKLDEGEFDAIILAEAGLRRLGWENRISLVLAPPVMFPATGQGAIGVECRADDERTRSALAHLDDPVTRIEVTAERACLGALRAGCHAPVGAWSTVEKTPTGATTLHFEAVIWSRDGSQRVNAKASGPGPEAALLGIQVARELREQGGGDLLR